MGDARYAPEVGATVWFNYPDSPDPMGKVVGFVAAGSPRAGQPIIEVQDDEPGLFGRKKGDRFATHPMFLLPFPLHGEEWQKANQEGRVG